MSYNFTEFTTLKTKEELVKLLGVDKVLFEFGLNKNLSISNTYSADIIIDIKDSDVFGFSQAKIPKKNGTGFREVWEIDHPDLLRVYKTFTRRFDLFLNYKLKNFPHESANGYLKRRNTYSNAKPHCGNKNILHVDLKDFFHSITLKRIETKLISLEIKPNVAKIIADLVTINGVLPLGFPSSPLISNLICFDLDKKISELCSKEQLVYTRYADDISISSNILPDKQKLQNDLKQIIESCDFIINNNKTRITKIGQAHFVTGLSVSDKNVPHVPKKMKRLLRQELFYCKKYSIEEHLEHKNADIDYCEDSEINRIDGTINYVAYIEKKYNLIDEWRKILKEENKSISYAPQKCPNTKYSLNIMVVDESEFHLPTDENVKFLAICVTLFSSLEAEKICTVTKDIFRTEITSPFSSSKKEVLKKEGLHFSSSSEDLKKAYISQLAQFSFRGYLGFIQLKNNNKQEYQTKYIEILSKLLPDRFKICDNTFLRMYIEQNNKLEEPELKDSIQKIYNNLTEKNDRRPLETPNICFIDKKNSLVPLPDYLLGVFGQYIKGNEPTERKEMFFEQLRDRYRLIADFGSNKKYSYKRPFNKDFWLQNYTN
ncbi:MAG: reverse transcriptase family protein [Alphaproteobacteria bacterium]|nr:reverse transcriptase family protein [Alphaproteobacteria bacterium]